MHTRVLLLITVMAFGMLGEAYAQPSPVSWKTDNRIVLLHRTANIVAPENTVPAFEAVVRQGADGFETDIRRTRDGVLVIYHDDWVLMQRGVTGKIEEMTLAETQKLDVGARFGPQWRGLRIPLFEDVLRFAKANDLRVFLDIKTKGISEEVMRVVKEVGAEPFIFKHDIPWISGWNYTDGGEEDPERMREIASRIPSSATGIMCDDARSIVRALGRRPEGRTLVPFVSTMSARLHAARQRTKAEPESTQNPFNDLGSADPTRRRAACLALARRPHRSTLETLLTLAEKDIDYTVRQEACWALGSLRADSAAPTLLRIAQTNYDSKTAAKTEYRDFFLKIAAACALARLNSNAGRTALNTLLASTAEYDRAAASVGLGAFGTEKDLPTLATLVDANLANEGFPSEFVMGYMGRFGAKAMPVYLAALSRNSVARGAVFGLASLGMKAVFPLTKIRDDAHETPAVRRRASLALEWMRGDH